MQVSRDRQDYWALKGFVAAFEGYLPKFSSVAAILNFLSGKSSQHSWLDLLILMTLLAGWILKLLVFPCNPYLRIFKRFGPHPKTKIATESLAMLRSRSLFEEDIQVNNSFLRDRLSSQSIANAVQVDVEAIAVIVHEEEVACEDRTMARRLNGTSVTSEVHLQSNTLNESILAKLGGLYIFEDIGEELCKATGADKDYQTETNGRAESSTAGSGRASSQTLRCIACHESKKFFDVARVPCGHDSCQPCIQELVDLATKDESLFPPCCCRQHFDMNDMKIMNFLTKDLKEQFERAKVEFDTRDQTYCCEGSCSIFLPPDTIEGDKATCGKSGTTTCFICKKAGHGGDFPEDLDLEATLNLANESGWQRCNVCRGLIELEHGCNHMTCRCGA